MKRKFTNVFLLVAIGIAALTAFVSCKDYEDDLRTESEIQNQELENLLRQDFQQQLTTLDNTLRGLITDLEGTVSEIKSCKCDTNALRENVLNIVKSYNYLTQNDIKDFVDTDSILNLIDKVLQSEATQDSLEKYFNLALDKAIQTQDFIDDLISQLTNDTYNSAFSEWVNNQIQEFTSDETFITNLTQNSSFIENISQNMMIPKDTVAKYMWEIFGPYKETLDTTLFDMNAAIVQLTDTLTNYVTKEQLAYEVDSIWREFSTVKTLTKNAQERADSAYQKAQDAAQAAANAATAAANAQNTADAAKTLAEAADKLAKELQTTVTGLKEAVDDLKPRVKKLEDDYATLSEFVNQVEGRVSKVELRVDTAMINAQKALDDVAALKDAYEATKKALEDKDIELDSTMTAHFDSINRRCDNIEKEIQEVLDSAYSLYLMGMDALQLVQQEMNYRIDSLAIDTRERLGQQGERIDNLEDSVASHLVRINTNELNIQNLMERMKNAEERIPALDKRIDSLGVVCDSILKRVEKLEEDVNDLYSKYESLNDCLNKLITSIIVQGTYNPIYGTFSTPFGIESNVLAVYYGDIRELEISEFPTYTDTYYYYPSTDYPEEDKIYLTKDEVEICKNRSFDSENDENEIFINEPGNAGTVYLTINSYDNTKDLSGKLNLKLVDTRDNTPANVTIESIEKEDNWLKTFGYSSRAANNGLYRAKVTINSDFVKVAPKFNIKRSDAEAILKDIKDNYETPSKINIGNIAKALYNVATSEVLPAYGIKAPWTDPQGDHAVYSAYNLAATAIHPLSYSFLAESKYQLDHVPGISLIEKKISDLADEIKKQLPHHLADEFGVEKFNLDSIVNVSLEDIDFDGFKVAVKYDSTISVKIGEITVQLDSILVPGDTIETTIPVDLLNELYFTYIDPNTGKPVIDESTGEPLKQYVQGLPAGVPATIIVDDQKVYVGEQTVDAGVKTVHLEFEYEDPEMTKMLQDKFNEMRSRLEGINPMLNYLRGYLHSINDLIDRVNEYSLDPMVDNFVDKLISYLDKFNAKLAPYMRITDWLQPIGLAYDGSKIYRLTSSMSNPVTVKKDNLSIILTSRTAEMLVPAYRKWVAVTKAYKNADGTEAPSSVVEAANKSKNMNKPMAGTVRKVDLNLQSGYTYVICYQAMDYSGHVSAKRYMLKVK